MRGTVGVKYCGGCNSRYDRAALVGQLAARFPEAEFTHAKPGVTYDLLLVVCGCTARCAGVTGLTGEKALTLCRAEDEAAAARLL